MSRSLKKGDYTRVCASCGTPWLLPEEWARQKAPRASQVRSMQRATRFAVGRQRERYSMQAVALQGTQDRVLANARCPSCGSSSFTQYKPGEVVPSSGSIVGTAGPSIPPGLVADELAKLAELRASGILTEEEFAVQKAKLLGS